MRAVAPVVEYNGHRIESARITFDGDFKGVTSSDGYLAFEVEDDSFHTLEVNVDDFKPYFWEGHLINGNVQLRVGNGCTPDVEGHCMELPPLQKLIIELPLVKVRGIHFVANDKRWLYRGATDFRLYQHFLEGHHIETVLSQRKELGANVVRVLSMATWIGTLPLHMLRDFNKVLNDYGLYLEFVALADCAAQGMDLNAQRARLDECRNQLDGMPGFIELVNEYDHHGTEVDPGKFSKPHSDTILFSRGSGNTDDCPYYPPWDYSTYHVRRDYPKSVVDSTAMELVHIWSCNQGNGFHQPVVTDEGPKAAPVPQNDRETDPFRFWQLGRAMSVSNGGTFHSNAGIDSALWTGAEIECARQFFLGMEYHGE